MARLFDDASTEYLENSNAVVSGPPFTIACWSYIDAALDAHQTFLGVFDGDSNNYYYVKHNKNGGPALMVYNGSTSGNSFSSGSHSLETWHHNCAVARAANDRSIFLDGGNEGINTTSVSPSGMDRTTMAGAYWGGTISSYMSGRIAEAAIWDVALTDAEVAVLATGVPPYFVQPDNLVAYWPLLRTDQDLVGGYDMTAYNTPSWADHPQKVWYPTGPNGLYLPAAAGGYTLTADQGTYTLSGQDASLLASLILTADQGTYSLSGQDTGLLFGRLLEADQGTYTLTGQGAELLLNRLIEAAQGTFTLSGQDATLTYTPIGGYTLVADQGTYTLSGQDLDLAASRLLEADQGTYSLTGFGTDFAVVYLLEAAQGSFTLSGQDAGLSISRLLEVGYGVYNVTGQDADLLRLFTMEAAQGTFTLSGQDVGLTLARILEAEQGTFALSGLDVTLLYSGIITPDSRIYVVQSENRVYIIALEDRTYGVAVEDRTFLIESA
jgi:hypothetical protein